MRRDGAVLLPKDCDAAVKKLEKQRRSERRCSQRSPVVFEAAHRLGCDDVNLQIRLKGGKLIEQILKRDDWNDYTIRCEGPRIRLWINGQQTIDYTEPDDKISREGVIAVQIHGGPPSEAWYKDIRIQKL